MTGQDKAIGKDADTNIGTNADDALKAFMQHIGMIEPQYTDIFGNGVAGMPGRSGASASAANSGVSITLQIRQLASDIARLCRDRVSATAATAVVAARDDLIGRKADELEGLLTVAVTVGVLSGAEADNCIGLLRDLQLAVRPA